jgi:hypothetical protein
LGTGRTSRGIATAEIVIRATQTKTMQMIEARTDIAVRYDLFGMSYDYSPQESQTSCRRSNSALYWSRNHLFEKWGGG